MGKKSPLEQKANVTYFNHVARAMESLEKRGTDYAILTLPEVSFKTKDGTVTQEASARKVQDAFYATAMLVLKSGGRSNVNINTANYIRSEEFTELKKKFSLVLYDNPRTGKKGLLIKRKGCKKPVWEVLYNFFY